MLYCRNCSMLSTILNKLWSLNPLQSGVTMLNNIVDNIEQYGQHNIVQSGFQQLVIFRRVHRYQECLETTVIMSYVWKILG